jgi:hypothetical protein
VTPSSRRSRSAAVSSLTSASDKTPVHSQTKAQKKRTKRKLSEDEKEGEEEEHQFEEGGEKNSSFKKRKDSAPIDSTGTPAPGRGKGQDAGKPGKSKDKANLKRKLDLAAMEDSQIARPQPLPGQPLASTLGAITVADIIARNFQTFLELKQKAPSGSTRTRATPLSVESEWEALPPETRADVS